MNCPNDGTVLALSDRNGIEIDYCPQCRGVWLDRGELDKILDRAGDQFGAPAASQNQGRQADVRGYGSGHGSGGHGSDGRKRRGGWLGELFD